MRWPRLMRRDRRDLPVGRVAGYVPGTWAQPGVPLDNSVVMPPPEPGVALISPSDQAPAATQLVPPPLVGPPVDETPQFPPQHLPPARAAHPTAPAPVPMSMPVPPATPGNVPVGPPVEAAVGPAVRLGFNDGSDVHLDPDNPHTKALKAVADVLTLRGPHRRRNVS